MGRAKRGARDETPVTCLVVLGSPVLYLEQRVDQGLIGARELSTNSPHGGGQ